MPSPIELTLTSLLPTINFLPPELIALSTSLLAQSRAKAANLKPEEEIARTYACCHIACQRLGHKLALEIATPAPPVKPKIYNKLHSYFNAVLATPKGTPRRGRDDIAPTTVTPAKRKEDRDGSKTPVASAVTPKPSASAPSAEGKEEDLPAYVLPMIRSIANTLGYHEVTAHVYVGMRTISQETTSHEPPTRRQKTRPKQQQTLTTPDGILGMLDAVFYLVITKMKGSDINDRTELLRSICSAVEGYCTKNTAKLPFSPTAYEDLRDKTHAMLEGTEAEKWQAMEWFTNVPEHQGNSQGADEMDLDEPTLSKPAKTPLRRKEKHVKRDAADDEEMSAAGLLPGLGTMFQPAVDWLSDEQRAEYAHWKKDIMAEAHRISTR